MGNWLLTFFFTYVTWIPLLSGIWVLSMLVVIAGIVTIGIKIINSEERKLGKRIQAVLYEAENRGAVALEIQFIPIFAKEEGEKKRA